MRNIIAVVLIVIGFGMFLCSIGCMTYGYVQTKEVDGWLGQAQFAGTADKMSEYLNNALGEMNRLGMTEGYMVTFPIPRNASHDMAIQYEVIQSIEERASYVAENAEPDTIRQSQALIDLRSDLENFNLRGTSWYILNHSPFLKLSWLFGSPWLVIGAIGIFTCKDE